MSHLPAFLGAVLAGGRSRRFGRDKTFEPVAGVPLVHRAAGVLAEVLPSVVIVSSRHSPEGFAWPVVPDGREPCGPLGGIEAALAKAEALGLEGAFVLACDLPLIGADVVRAVAAAAESAPAAAPARTGRPPFEPLCAAYRIPCLAIARALLDAEVRAAQELLEAVGGVIVDLPRADFLNVNAASDRASAERRLRGKGR